jgi:glutamate/tyrosine decarboxylase-like PLP-dependent enzyme
MNQHLDQDRMALRQLLTQTLDTAIAYLETLDTRPAATNFVQKDALDLPDEGIGAAQTLDLFAQHYGDKIPASNGARFWGFVTGGTTPAALMGDWLVSAYDLNLTSAANSIAPNIELEAIHLLRQLFGLPDAMYGTFVTGATQANVVGLAIAREWVARQYGKSIAEEGVWAVPPITVLSSEAHSSIYKALSVLGLGRKSLVKVATLPDNREAIDVEVLHEALRSLDGQPCVVVANAGTVNTVDFDDLAAIAALKLQYPFWLHVDAAFGGFAACSPQYQHLVAGMAEADSLTIDAHKWLNVPYDAAMLFTPHQALQIDVFQNSAAYLGAIADPPDFVHLSPENSRRMRSLPAWFSLMAYGKAGYKAIVEQNCALARQFGDRIAASSAFRLLAPVRMNVVCFTLTEGEDLVSSFLSQLRQDGRVFMTPTVYSKTPGIRAAFSNWRTTADDIDIAWQAMLETVQVLEKK